MLKPVFFVFLVDSRAFEGGVVKTLKKACFKLNLIK